MEYIRDYFSRAMDFSGEEQGDTYRRYCLIHVARLLVLNFALPILAAAITLIFRSDFFKELVGFLMIAVSIIWVEPIVAATFRRTWTLKKSKIWIFIVLLPYCSLLTWLLLGKDKEA